MDAELDKMGDESVMRWRMVPNTKPPILWNIFPHEKKLRLSRSHRNYLKKPLRFTVPNSDKEWGLVDYISFVAMQRAAVTQALIFSYAVACATHVKNREKMLH